MFHNDSVHYPVHIGVEKWWNKDASLLYSCIHRKETWPPPFKELSVPENRSVSRSIIPTGIHTKAHKIPKCLVMHWIKCPLEINKGCKHLLSEVMSALYQFEVQTYQTWTLTVQLSDTSACDFQFTLVADGWAPCLVHSGALSRDSCCIPDIPFSLFR